MSLIIYVDGASSGNPGDSGAGIVILDAKGNELHRESIFLGKMTNNMAEYEALLRGLQKAAQYGEQDIVVHTDSLLVANQVLGLYKINNDVLREYCRNVRGCMSSFKSFTIKHIPREQNKIADKLAKNGIKMG